MRANARSTLQAMMVASCLTRSRWVRFLLRLAFSKAAPSSLAHRRYAAPSRSSSGTSVGLTANCGAQQWRKPVQHNFEPPVVQLIYHGQVHVMRSPAKGNSSSSLRGCRAFQRVPPTSLTPHRCTRHSVVAGEVEWLTTPCARTEAEEARADEGARHGMFVGEAMVAWFRCKYWEGASRLCAWSFDHRYCGSQSVKSAEAEERPTLIWRRQDDAFKPQIFPSLIVSCLL